MKKLSFGQFFHIPIVFFGRRAIMSATEKEKEFFDYGTKTQSFEMGVLHV
jgi:hypothetical protein